MKTNLKMNNPSTPPDHSTLDKQIDGILETAGYQLFPQSAYQGRSEAKEAFLALLDSQERKARIDEANWWNTVGYGDFVAAEERITELNTLNGKED